MWIHNNFIAAEKLIAGLPSHIKLPGKEKEFIDVMGQKTL